MTTPPDPAPRPRFALLAALLGAACLTLWLAWPTLNYSHDAVAYAAIVHRAVYAGPLHILWHPYHMLYMPMGWAVARGLLAAGLVVDVLGLLQVINAVLSALLVVTVAAAARRLTGRNGLALAAAALLAASLPVSYFATDPEVYPPSLLALAVAFLVLLRLLESGRARDAALSGVALGLACAFHAAACLALPPALLVAGCGVPGGRRRRALLIGILVVGFSAPVAAPYAVLWHARGLDPASGAADLARNVARTSTFESGPWLLGRGFRPDQEARAVLRGVADDPVDGGGATRLAASCARALAAALAALTLLRLPALWRRQRWPTLALAGWLVSFFLLFSAYNVGSLKFIGFLLLPFVLLLAAAVATLPVAPGRIATGAIASIAVLAGSANLVGTLIPWSRPGSNPDLARAEWVGSRTEPGDLVVALGQGPNVLQRVYLPYFGEREVLLLDLAFSRPGADPATTAARLAAEIDSRLARGVRVLALSDLVEDAALQRRFEHRFELPPGTVAGLLAAFQAQRHASHDPEFALWELRRRPSTGAAPGPATAPPVEPRQGGIRYP